LDGFPAVYAMCAIDALGIPAMAGRDGRIAATDPRDGAPVVVSVKGAGEVGGGRWRWTPAGAVVVFARTRDCGTNCAAWEMVCPHITFHASRDSAQAYLAARPDIDGEILGQQASVESGRCNFGPLLGGSACASERDRMTAGTGRASARGRSGTRPG
ncbi:MAG: organomercurial lyase, partial [Streptosporangiaceae bacterium]